MYFVKKMKRSLAALLAVIMIVALMPVSAIAAETDDALQASLDKAKHINFSTIDPSKSQHELESLLNEYSYPTTAILNLSTRELSLKAESFIKGYEKFVELQKQPKTPEVRQLEMMFKQEIEREQTLENVCTIFDDCCRILDLDPDFHSSVLNDVLNTVRKERLGSMKD